MMYVIRSGTKKWSDGSPKYWSEPLQDWVIRMDATVYTYEQMKNYEGWLPVSGEWVKL